MTYVPASEPEPVALGPQSTVRFVAPGSATAGRFGLFEFRMAAGAGGAIPHYHQTFSESFYVVSGTPSILDGTQWSRTAPGDFVFVPERGVHGFRNDGDSPATLLILFAPGFARERYFTELAEIYATERPLSVEEFTALLARHDQVNL